ncbi:MAG: macrolide ABC transporter ATP-binding protein [Polycyclovorans sp.]|nr:macrolide ABC transporter ATP-binding protein [Polycyclovorans sp.]MBU0788869.1 ABC transporter ATP-binding protein [Gammaproteobacteria bacterium]|tara:strand:- start:1673 stop:2377 length:705 start_codon:yes stop_codon:yes gene_type:complete
MADAALLSLQGVTRIYPMGGTPLMALKGLDLRIEAGESVAIMGSSGSGKSTLMNILGCLDRPTEGQYRLQGQDVAGLSRRELADIRNRFIGFVFQSFNLLTRTSAQENVELPLLYANVSARDRRARARAALQRVGLGERLDHHPSQLSGGQQQRVAIARALVTEAPLLLADEPTGNLDSATSVDIMRLLQGLNAEGMTVVLVTHEADIAAHARRVITLRDGVIGSDRTQAGVRA